MTEKTTTSDVLALIGAIHISIVRLNSIADALTVAGVEKKFPEKLHEISDTLDDAVKNVVGF